MGQDSQQILTFALDNGLFAVPTETIQEVLLTPKITPIPGTPPGVAGVMNLRGKIVPVLDARDILGMGTDTPGTHLVVFQDQEEAVALVVERIEAIIHTVAWRDTVPDHVDLRWRRLLQGYYYESERFVFVWRQDAPSVLWEMLGERAERGEGRAL